MLLEKGMQYKAIKNDVQSETKQILTFQCVVLQEGYDSEFWGAVAGASFPWRLQPTESSRT